MRTKLDNGVEGREIKWDRGKVTRNFLINSINVNFDRSIVGTFHSSSRDAKTTEIEIATTLPLGAIRMPMQIERDREKKQTISTLHISVETRQYQLTRICDADTYPLNKSLNFDFNKSNYIIVREWERKKVAHRNFYKVFAQQN